MADLDKIIGLEEKKCAKCGKLFVPSYHHTFKQKGKGKYWCSWTCFNHRNDKHETG
jgi:uncharacterized OB-fold protein